MLPAHHTGHLAVRVMNVSKCYRLYDKPQDRLKQAIFPRLRRVGGLPIRHYAREFWALKDVSFEVKKGETVGIIGRNGSGKSTLLQIICGTLAPTTGTVETNGRIAALLELGAGFNPEFTGRENVYMNGSLYGLKREEIDARFDQIAAFADIGEFIEQPVKTYSSGMFVRLAFAVITQVDADILIVDEALSVGDAYFVQKCMRYLRSFMERGTLLFCSHDTGAVVSLCSKAVLLDQGRLSMVGTPKEVTERYLAAIYESSQGDSEIETLDTMGSDAGVHLLAECRDMRESLINSSTLRNDIEVFKFEQGNQGFGTGAARILSVRLLDRTGTPLSWVVGGEDVILESCCKLDEALSRPIVGFQFKDRLGQVVFSDNTFLAYQHSPLAVARGCELVARFEFRLPLLPTGDYSITVAVADGSQDSHVQLHWMHEALIIRVHASSVCQGLVGVPMKAIKLAAALRKNSNEQ